MCKRVNDAGSHEQEVPVFDVDVIPANGVKVMKMDKTKINDIVAQLREGKIVPAILS